MPNLRFYFLMVYPGISIGDISYLLRNILKLLDTETELNVKTKVDLKAVNNLDEINIVVKIV